MKGRPILYSKENFCINFILSLAFLFMGISCASTNPNGSQSSVQQTSVKSGFALPQQKAPPNDIQSIQLHPKENPGGAPILQLNSEQKLILSFDYLGEQSRQFRLEISHRTQDWDQSSITPSTFLDSFSYTYIQNAKESFSQPPSYWHVEHEFPGELKPVVSGNYLLEIYDYNSGELLFSIPFFVTENQGVLDTRVETLFAQRDDGRPLDQLFSTYQFPNLVEFPQFDLSMSFVQNQFWGRMRKAGFLDTITPGELNGQLERQQAYVGNYEFKTLDLRSFDPDGQQILEYQPGNTPPDVLLRRDVQNLDTNPRYFPGSDFGTPLDDRNSSYARVMFSLETEASIPLSSDIYLVGHFNNWMINPLNKMSYNQDNKLWEGHALIKQGQYAYKYILVRDGEIDDLALDQSFLSAEQEYLTFVYFKDPNKNFDRLLKVNRVVKK